MRRVDGIPPGGYAPEAMRLCHTLLNGAAVARGVVLSDDPGPTAWAQYAGWAALILAGAALLAIAWSISLRRTVARQTAEMRARDRQAEEDRVALRVAEQSTLAKSRFLASMSHELRTPLNAVIGFSEMLKDGMAGSLTEQQTRYMESIYNSGMHLLALINDILDLSRIEAGKQQLEPALVDTADLLRNSLSIVADKAMAHAIALDLELDGDPGPVMVDARKLKQIVYNLLSNAVKFTPDGGRVTVAARRATGPGGEAWLEIAVSDTGIGIAAEDLERLFKPFEQLDASLSRHYEGTGLGLAIVRSLVDLHGGEIDVVSAPGQGSRFTVKLPCRPRDRQPA